MKRNFKRKVLNNGLTILFEKRKLPVVSVAFAVKEGGINEKISEKGLSHFIEHMLYKGTSKRNSMKIAEEIEKNGGDLNGFTSETITAYWCKMPSNHLGVALDVLSDMIKNSLFDKKELEKERKVIFEEIKMHKDNPRLHIFDKIQECLYTGTMGMNLAGTIKTMKSLDKDKLVKRFKEIYTPNNLVLVVVGNADFNKIVNFAKENFPEKKSRSIKVQEFKKHNLIKTEKRRDIDQANLIFAYHSPLAGDKRSYAARVLSVLTAGGMSSRLFTEIREKRNLAYAIKGDSDITKYFAFNFIYVGTTKENVETVKKIILKELKDVSETLTEEELEQVKKQMIGNHRISMEDSQLQLVNLLVSEVNKNAEEYYDFEKNISKVKLKDVIKLAGEACKKYSFFALVPA